MSPSLKLQKWQANQLFEAIQGVGLDPREFKFENSDSEVQLKHKWSTSYFILDDDAGATYAGRCLVGDGYPWPFTAYLWQTLIDRFNRWVREVKLDLDTPNLWAELQRESELLGEASNDATENTPFTPEEQREIERRLREAEERIKLTYSLSTEQIRVLHTKIDYLVEAARRLCRIDWRNAFVGVALGYVVMLALPPESARSIFQTFVTLLRAVGHLYGLPQLPLGTS